MAVIADIQASSNNPHPAMIIDQLHDLVPPCYFEPSPLGSTLIRMLCMDDFYGRFASDNIIVIDPKYVSWLPDYVKVLDDEYNQIMAIVEGAEENGSMHDEQLQQQLDDVGRRGFMVMISQLSSYHDSTRAESGGFPGLDLLKGREYKVIAHVADAECEASAVPLVYTAQADGTPIRLHP